MQRGVLVLNKEELTQLLTVLDISKFNGSPLFNKLTIASNTTDNEVRISISEDEIERILDEIGPTNNDNPTLNSGLQKISNLMLIFRK